MPDSAPQPQPQPQTLYNAPELARAVAARGFDALVLRSGRNVAYLSGMRFPGTLGRLQDFAHSPRAALLVWPRAGEPTLFASAIAAPLARRHGWLTDVRPFTEYRESPYRLAARELAARGLGRGRIGVERREMGAAQWDEFRAELPDAELVECSEVMEAVRNVKTPGELALLRRAAEAQDEAHLEVFGAARPGDTERQLHARMVAAMLARGAESAHGMLQASTNPVTYGGEGDTPIRPGVVVRTDYVCYLDGYAANLSRMAVMGAPSAAQAARYATLRDIHRAAIAGALRPGVAAEEVYAFARERLEMAGSTVIAALVGHSVGVWWHQEEPMLIPGERRVLRPGMVVCLEPILDGFWHLQDEILITDGAPELLSTRFNTDELFVMGAGG